MQIIESSPFALRTAVMRLKSAKSPTSFTLFPMVHVGEPAFYDEVATRLKACDIILCEGVKSPTSSMITMSYRFYAQAPHLGLVLQRQMDLSSLKERLVHADVSGPDFEKRWSELPLWLRYGLPIAAPVFGLYMRHFGTRANIAARMSMNLRKTRLESLSEPERALAKEVIIDWRDRHLIDVIAREQAKANGKEINIGILFGARHMRAVLRYLLWDQGYRASKSEWVTVFSL